MVDWWFFEEMEGFAPLPFTAQCDGATLMKKHYGFGISKLLCVNQNGIVRFHIPKNEALEGAKVLEKLHDSSFIKQFKSDLMSACEKADIVTQPLEKDLSKKTNAQLVGLLHDYYIVHRNVMIHGILPNELDYAALGEENTLSVELKKYLSTKESDPAKVEEYFAILTASEEKTVSFQERVAFLKAAASKESIDDKAAALSKQFGWNSFLFAGPVKWTVHYYQQMLASYQGDATKGLKSLLSQHAGLRERKKEIIKSLKIDAQHAHLFNSLAELIFLKTYRKDNNVLVSYRLNKLAKESARRLGITLKQVQHMLFDELVTALGKGKVDQSFLEELNVRVAFSVLTSENGRAKIYSGEKARDLAPRIEEEKIIQTNELRGTCACPGKATGKVRIINKAEEMAKMRKGDVLVSVMTQPEIVPAMSKAAAIVTDQGGLTCHAVIVSRELGVPCVIGTKRATKVLKDGVMVEVDATRGIVKLVMK